MAQDCLHLAPLALPHGFLMDHRHTLELNRRVLVEKMRSIPAAAKELSDELEDCKDGPYLEACSKLPQLITQLQADLAA